MMYFICLGVGYVNDYHKAVFRDKKNLMTHIMSVDWGNLEANLKLVAHHYIIYINNT